MTKRALSLLLTLVMVLSLCVPALAAEEFEAEAPAEVVEEAPVAPEAPVEPEAEEPAEEPVVDEPAVEEPVEEPVVDAPEMASILEEELEDQPYLVALGIVSGTYHYKLEKALEAAAPYKEKVDNDELYVPGGYTDVDQEESPAAAFLEAYETAQKNLDAINGQEVDIDVNDASVKAATDKLLEFIPEKDGGTAEQELTDVVDTTEMTDTELFAGLKAGESYDGSSPYEGSYPALTASATADFTSDEWTVAYRSEYLKALADAQAAIKAFTDLGDDAKYKDFAAARKAVLAAAELEEDAVVAGEADAKELADAIAAAKKIGADKYADKEDDYVAYNADLFDVVIPAAEDLLDEYSGLNGLADDVLYYDVHKAILDINNALVKKTNTLKFEKATATGEGTIEVIVSIANITGDPAADSSEEADGNTYGFAYQVGKWWQDSDNDATNTDDTKNFSANENIIGIYVWEQDTTNYPGRLVAKLTLTPTDDPAVTSASAKSKFTSSDSIKIGFFMQNATGSDGEITWGSQFQPQTIKFPKDPYYGPTIKSATIVDYNDDEKIEYEGLDTLDTVLNAYIDGGNIEAEVKLTGNIDKDYSNLYKVIIKTNKNKIVAEDDGAFDTSDNTITVKDSDNNDAYYVAGDMQVALLVDLSGDTAYEADKAVTHGTGKVNIAPLSKWSQIDIIKEILADAKALDKNDYDLSTDIPRGDVETVAEAFQVINKNIDKIEKDISSTTVANSKKNREAVIESLKILAKVYKYLVPKSTVNVDALKALMDTVDELDEDDYTYDTYGALTEAIEDADEALAARPLLQSKIDAAYKALKAAYDALLKVTDVDKSGLEASIAAAEALKEEDYTPESWADNKAAIDAAKSAAEIILESENASQAQVNSAKSTLDAAMGKLVKLVTVDKTALAAAIAKAEALDEADYTAESWADVAEALEAAEAVEAKEDATQDEVDAAVKALADAVAKLEAIAPEVDKTQLEGTIAEAEAKVEADYTEESWAAMAEALEAAKDVAADEEATQEAVDGALELLQAAIDSLEPAESTEPADKSELIAGIAVITALSEYKDEFTAESWAAVEAALEAAQAVLDDENATQDEVDAAVAAMVEALEALEEVPAVIPPAPSSGTGWVENDAGDIYFYQKGEVKKSFWVGKADGASKWDGNWYYVGADGKLVTGMAYLDDLHGGYGWYFLQPTNKNGEIGKMLTGWQWVGDIYGTCYFSTKSGSSGKCTYSNVLGDWNGTTWVPQK